MAKPIKVSKLVYFSLFFLQSLNFLIFQFLESPPADPTNYSDLQINNVNDINKKNLEFNPWSGKMSKG